MTYLETILVNPFFLSGFSLVASFMLSVRLYPAIIFLAHKKNLMDEPEDRSIHKMKTPTLGGVGLFITFSLTSILLALFVGFSQADLIKHLALLAAINILLFLGIKDDLLVLSPSKKIGGQIVAACIVIFFADARMDTLFGLFGIEELPYSISVLLSIFVYVFTINAFNLVDGIDGLAASIAIIVNTTFGIFFLLNDQVLLTAISFILIGALMGFLKYNLSDTRKIFMGDSGSMFIGFLLTFEAIYFLEMNSSASSFAMPNAPIVVLAIFSFPILDTLRVFFIRIYKGQSPFKADQNHIHHGLLRLGIGHKQATLLVSLSIIFNIGLAFIISSFYINLQLYILCIIYPAICLLPFVKMDRKGLNSSSISTLFKPKRTAEHTN